MGRRKKYNYNNKKCFDIYQRKIEKGIEIIPYTAFEIWYESKEKKCAYCGITEQESELLFNRYPGRTRGGRRGKSLELERKVPSSLYDDLGNFDLACYWCNNAKSNYFTIEEFTEIAQTIARVNKKRLSLLMD